MSQPSKTASPPLRLGVWAGDGNNTHFLDPILERLPARYEVVRMGTGGSPDQIEQDLQRVDVAWFEWATGPIIPGSARAAHVPTVLRLHRYEAYTDTPRMIDWKNVDHLILINRSVRASMEKMHPRVLDEAPTEVHYIPNGLDTTEYPLEPGKTRNHNVAFVGRLHLVKNPMLLVQVIDRLVRADRRYCLHVAGEVQHYEVWQYLQYHVEQLGLGDHVRFYGALNPSALRQMLGACSYILSSSVIESQGVGVMEGMAMGLKPVIHDFYGARDLFEAGMLWNTIDEAVRLITRGSYEPAAYRRFIEAHFSLSQQVNAIVQVLDRAAAQYHPERVAALLEAPPEVFGEAAVARVQQAQAHADAGRYREGLAALAGVDFAALDPDAHLEARVLALQLALTCEAATEALRHADVLTDLAPDEPLALHLAGRALWAAGQHQAALNPLVAAAERIEADGHRLPFDAEQIRQDAFDACTALGRTRIAGRFAPTAVA